MALCQDAWQLMAARAIAALGASSFFSVGTGSIADVFEVEERGSALGLYFAVSFLDHSI
jgi:MFS family permease